MINIKYQLDTICYCRKMDKPCKARSTLASIKKILGTNIKKKQHQYNIFIIITLIHFSLNHYSKFKLIPINL